MTQVASRDFLNLLFANLKNRGWQAIVSDQHSTNPLARKNKIWKGM